MQKAGSQPTRASAFPTEATTPNQGRTGPGLFRRGAAFIFVRWDIGSEHQGRLRAGGLSRVAAEDGVARSDSGHGPEIDPLELARIGGEGRDSVTRGLCESALSAASPPGAYFKTVHRSTPARFFV